MADGGVFGMSSTLITVLASTYKPHPPSSLEIRAISPQEPLRSPHNEHIRAGSHIPSRPPVRSCRATRCHSQSIRIGRWMSGRHPHLWSVDTCSSSCAFQRAAAVIPYARATKLIRRPARRVCSTPAQALPPHLPLCQSARGRERKAGEKGHVVFVWMEPWEGGHEWSKLSVIRMSHRCHGQLNA
jgi:hypothetical protein